SAFQTLSLHDALPIFGQPVYPVLFMNVCREGNGNIRPAIVGKVFSHFHRRYRDFIHTKGTKPPTHFMRLMRFKMRPKDDVVLSRSEEHTSELQSRENL